MNKETLTTLFAQALFQIPDYQRGYAWEEKQWKDFIEDIDALADKEARGHYTGTVVVYERPGAEERPYGRRSLKVVDVVDGQQRLTTTCLYLSVIIRALINHGETDYQHDIPEFLYSGATCKLTLNNETGDLFYDLLKSGHALTPVSSPHQWRLVSAVTRFQKHIDGRLATHGAEGADYLKGLYKAITQKLHFTFYKIEEESEIGMTFELMNSRGKDLSVLELLKNYLMHWVSRNEADPAQRRDLTNYINKSWKTTYTNLGAGVGSEDQCLRVAWTLYCSHPPTNWKGYDGFKDDEYIPLRNFQRRTRPATKAYIERFVAGLAETSRHYAIIMRPTEEQTISPEELRWLTKIHHTGNIANFLPLMVAARKHRVGGNIAESDYIALLKALECYAYRVFLYDRRRSNAGITSLYRWGCEVFNQPQNVRNITLWVHGLIRDYSSEESFTKGNAEPDNWYKMGHLLKYTLFEYELHLLKTEGHGKQPHLSWKQLNDSTIEHILPQNPPEDSHWNAVWGPDIIRSCVHDIANLVLTRDNSSYSNFEFVRKKGQSGQGIGYINSDIRQERRLARFTDWTPKEFMERRGELMAWINERWKTVGGEGSPMSDIADVPDEDGTEAASEEVLV